VPGLEYPPELLIDQLVIDSHFQDFGKLFGGIADGSGLGIALPVRLDRILIPGG
jgi:hypothetical protein